MENKITLEKFYDLIDTYNMRCEFGKEITRGNIEGKTLKSMERDGYFESDKYVVILIDHRDEPEFNDSMDFRYHVLMKTKEDGYNPVGNDLISKPDYVLFEYNEIPEKYRALAIKESEIK